VSSEDVILGEVVALPPCVQEKIGGFGAKGAALVALDPFVGLEFADDAARESLVKPNKASQLTLMETAAGLDEELTHDPGGGVNTSRWADSMLATSVVRVFTCSSAWARASASAGVARPVAMNSMKLCTRLSARFSSPS
jgi:hypothetical protein